MQTKLFAQSLGLDSTFSDDGIFSDYIPCVDGDLDDIQFQADGKILLTGTVYYYATYPVVIRLLPNGTIDSTYGINGMCYANPQGYTWISNDGALQADEKLVIGGQDYLQSFSVLRVNVSGNSDSTFGNSGKVIVTLPGYSNGNCQSILVQPDQKIVGVGLANNSKCVALRMLDDGTLDSTFHFSGIQILESPTFDYSAHLSVAMQSDSKLVIAGVTVEDTSSFFSVVRLKDNGDIDSSFGTSGSISCEVFGDDNSVVPKGLVIQPDGKIVVCGIDIWIYPYAIKLELIRLNENGSLDSSFGENGMLISDIGAAAYWGAGCTTLDSAGGILIGGSSNDDIGVVRCSGNGIDSTFGSNGFLAANLPCYCAGTKAQDIAIDQDGKIVISGMTSEYQYTAIRMKAEIATPSFNIHVESIPMRVNPNPMPEMSMIDFSLVARSHLSLTLFNLEGRKIRSIAEGNFDRGNHQVIFQKENLNEGVYLLRLNAENGFAVQKIIIE